MFLILDPLGEYHVSLDTVAEVQEAMLRDSRVRTVRTNRVLAKATGRMLRLLKHAHLHFPGERNGTSTADYIAVLMSVDPRRCLPYFVFSGRKSVYLMDAWPEQLESIREFVKKFSVRQLFLSSSVAAEILQGDLPECTVTWIPEAVDPGPYRFRPMDEKDIDVLQLGRKYDKLHEMILPVLEQNARSYLFEKVRGKIVFPTREEFLDGLARTKISICVPANITHPECAGPIEVLSTRYLQSMVSKCLVVGHAPTELVSLFGYNPVVEIDMRDPGGQILSLLDHLDAYASLIERNHETVTQHHTWNHRWAMMARVLYSGQSGTASPGDLSETDPVRASRTGS
jgi:hypothetical protein